MKEAELKAYALGYFHGRTEGVDGDPYVDGVLRHLYGQGYDAGVSDYADFDIATDETRSNGPRSLAGQ